MSKRKVKAKGKKSYLRLEPKVLDFGAVVCDGLERSKDTKLHNESSTKELKFHFRSIRMFTIEPSKGIVKPGKSVSIKVQANFSKGGRESFVLGVKGELYDPTDESENIETVLGNLLVQVGLHMSFLLL